MIFQNSNTASRFATFILFFGVSVNSSAQDTAKGKYHAWWNEGFPQQPKKNPKARRQEPWQPKWEEDFGFTSNDYPIIATEIGFDLRGNNTNGPDHYAYQITKYLEGKGISWTAWVFDPEWWPQLFRSWDTYELTPTGEFFKQAMHANK